LVRPADQIVAAALSIHRRESMKKILQSAMLIAGFVVASGSHAQNYANRLDAAYSLNCSDPQSSAFVIRRFSDIFMLMTFDKGELSGAAVVTEVIKDKDGATFNVNAAKPAYSFRYRFLPAGAKLIELAQDGKKIVENERILSNKQDSPTYSICAKGTPFFAQTLEPNWPKISPGAEEIADIKRQTKIEKTVVSLTPEVRDDIEKKIAASAVAKKESDEKLAAEKLRQDQEKAQKEAEKQAERQRQAEEAKRQEEAKVKKEAETQAAQRESMKKIKVNNVALGANSKLPCDPKAYTYENQFNEPTMVMFTCEFGAAGDHNEIFFASDKKRVVRAVRKQFLKETDPEASEVVRKAVEYYGAPFKVDLNNWLAVYGDAFSVTYNGNNGQPVRNGAGVGLSIKGRICGIDKNCPSTYRYVVEYELVDVGGYDTAMKEGKERLAGKSKQKLDSMKF